MCIISINNCKLKINFKLTNALLTCSDFAYVLISTEALLETLYDDKKILSKSEKYCSEVSALLVE